MTLGEAQTRLEQINQRLSDIAISIKRGPTSNITEALDEHSGLMRERQSLEERLLRAKLDLKIEGSSLWQLEGLLVSVRANIEILEDLRNRSDIAKDSSAAIYEQLTNFRTLRDNLHNIVQRCLWSTELLE